MPDGRLALLDQARSEVVLVRSGWSPPGAPATARLALDGRPRRIAVDKAGRVYALDAGGWIRKLGGDGRLLARWDARGPAPSAQTAIADIAVQADGTVLAADARSGAIHRFVAVPAADPRAADPAGAACRLAPHKSASPGRVRLGEPVTVTLAVDGVCPRRAGADIVLLLARGSGDGASAPELDAAVPFARAFVGRADLTRHRVGIVSHQLAFTPTVAAPLSADPAVLLGAIGGCGPTARTRSPAPANARLPRRRPCSTGRAGGRTRAR